MKHKFKIEFGAETDLLKDQNRGRLHSHRQHIWCKNVKIEMSECYSMMLMKLDYEKDQYPKTRDER